MLIRRFTERCSNPCYEEFDGSQWGRILRDTTIEAFEGHKAYCAHCKGVVHTMTATCPFCRKLIWELLATIPFDYEHKLRTTKATYAGAFESIAPHQI